MNLIFFFKLHSYHCIYIKENAQLDAQKWASDPQIFHTFSRGLDPKAHTRDRNTGGKHLNLGQCRGSYRVPPSGLFPNFPHNNSVHHWHWTATAWIRASMPSNSPIFIMVEKIAKEEPCKRMSTEEQTIIYGRRINRFCVSRRRSTVTTTTVFLSLE